MDPDAVRNENNIIYINVETCDRTRGIQEVDLERQGAENAFPGVEILHGGPVPLAETLAEQSAYYGALANPCAAEHHQPDSLEIGHILRWVAP